MSESRTNSDEEAVPQLRVAGINIGEGVWHWRPPTPEERERVKRLLMKRPAEQQTPTDEHEEHN